MLVLAERWVCSVAWVSFGGSVGEELLPVVNTGCYYHYCGDCIH